MPHTRTPRGCRDHPRVRPGRPRRGTRHPPVPQFPTYSRPARDLLRAGASVYVAAGVDGALRSISFTGDPLRPGHDLAGRTQVTMPLSPPATMADVAPHSGRPARRITDRYREPTRRTDAPVR